MASEVFDIKEVLLFGIVYMCAARNGFIIGAPLLISANNAKWTASLHFLYLKRATLGQVMAYRLVILCAFQSLLCCWFDWQFLDIRAVTDFYGCVAVYGFAICMRFGNNIVLLTSKIVPNNDDILYEPVLLVRYIDQITSKNISLFMLVVGFHEHKTVRPQVSSDQ